MYQIIVILLFCVFNVGAQNAFHVSNKTSGDTLLSIDNDGNLGIRVPIPGARLDVGMYNSGFWQRGIRLLNPALENGNQLMLTIGRSDDVNNAGNLYFTYDAEASELNRLSLGLYAVNDVLNILANGRVGIRTVEPQTSFEVNGAMKISGTGDLPEQVHYGMVMAGYYDDTDIGKIYVGDNSGWKFHFARRLGSTDTELMTIVDYGNVGIGTTDPQEKLEVAGTVHSTSGGFRFPDGSLQETAAAGSGSSLWQENETDIYYNSGNVGIGTTSPSAGLHLSGTGYPNSFMFIESSENNDAGLRLYEGSTAKWHIFNSALLNGLQIYNTGGSSTVFFADQSTGNVGIGLTNPDQKLVVADTIRSAVGGFQFPDGTVQITAATGEVGVPTDIDDLLDGKTGGNSVFLGYGAGLLDDGTTNNNTAVGLYALNANITGHGNTASGYHALNTTNGGSNNTASGHTALEFNTTGNNNVAIGYGADYQNQEGSENTIIGAQAGSGTSLHNKSGNVFLGFGAGYNETGDNKLYIENSNSATPLIWGDFSLDSLVINGNLHVTGNVEVEGEDRIIAIDDLADGKSDGSSLYLGYEAGINDEESDTRNTAVGTRALYMADGDLQNTAIGYEASYEFNGGESNTAIGYSALRGDHLAASGWYNVACGAEALFNKSEGYNNVATGYRALYNNGGSHSNMDDYRHGSFNIATGTEALYSNTGGAHNVAIGYQALFTNEGSNNDNYFNGDFNIAIGSKALYAANPDDYYIESNACYNIAIGYHALYNSTIGNGLVAVGHNSGLASVDGDYNTFIGYGADAASGNLDNATAIGYNAVVDASNKVRLGNSNVTVIEGQVDFTYTSDKNKKENFQNIDSKDVLQKLSTFNIQSWNYKHDPEAIRHYGPVAQDFYAAFGHDGIGQVGSDTTLCGSDVNGINMVAIQALEKRTRELKAENEQLKAEMDDLKSKFAQMEDVLRRLVTQENHGSEAYVQNQNKHQ